MDSDTWPTTRDIRDRAGHAVLRDHHRDGALGIQHPVVPVTPFVILAALAFRQSAPESTGGWKTVVLLWARPDLALPRGSCTDQAVNSGITTSGVRHAESQRYARSLGAVDLAAVVSPRESNR